MLNLRAILLISMTLFSYQSFASGYFTFSDSPYKTQDSYLTHSGQSLKINLHRPQKGEAKPGYSIAIPLSSEVVHKQLLYIILYISIAGQEYSSVYPPIPNQTALFTWDGKDTLGRELNGYHSIKIFVGYKYKTRLDTVENTLNNFNKGRITVEYNSDSMILWHSWTDRLGAWDTMRSIYTFLDT